MSSEKNNYRPSPFYGMLVCGLLIFFIGIYLSIEHMAAAGKGFSGRYNPTGQTQFITGPGAMILGLGIAVVPAYHLLKYRKRK